MNEPQDHLGREAVEVLAAQDEFRAKSDRISESGMRERRVGRSSERVATRGFYESCL